jgi:hypothetical protein
MTPVSYTVNDGVTTFHYKPSELRKFYKLGKRDGDVGMILKSRKGNMITYSGFGTIENPRTVEYSMSLIMMPFEEMSDDERLVPPKLEGRLSSYRFDILDFGMDSAKDVEFFKKNYTLIK